MMGFGEMLVSAVVKEVVQKLGSALWGQIGLHWGFKNDMVEMKKNLEMIEDVLADAEKQSVKEKSICRWLNELKSTAYDIEDMMCDFETKIPPNKEGRLGDWLQRVWLNAKKVNKQIGLVKQMKKMKERLGQIAKRRSEFILSSGNSFDIKTVVKQRVTSSAINKKMILGREAEKDELMSLLMQSDGVADTSIICIIGLGGIGKTTLAQLLYNDEWVKKNFKRGWVYVSMEFDLIKIGRALIESFEVNSTGNIPETLDGINKCLENKIRDKYFIVLDDLWEEDGENLRKLMEMLPKGVKGSKIIITTRNKNVVVRSRATQSYNLKGLLKGHCWDLFALTASMSKCEKEDKDLVKIGMEIVEKCGGIPLAVIALAYIMQLKKDVDSWKEVRDSDIWRLEEPTVLPSLKLSYYFMPSYLKLCFAYFSIFPKGHNISRNEIIQQWIALGFIQLKDEGMSMEKRGQGYVDDLMGMSFLQRASSSSLLLRMHDVVHDLARYVIGNELLILDGKKNVTDHVANPDYRYALLLNFNGLTKVCPTWMGKIRAIHCHECTLFDNPTKNKKNFFLHTLRDAKYLRLFYLISDRNPRVFNHNLTTFLHSIGNLKQLRYLYAAAAGFEILPESFDGPRNLRYLCMSNNPFKMLPVPFGNLTNLQVLILDNCLQLEFLAEPFNLVNLQELSLKDCTNLKKLPDSISSLTKLQILDVSYCRNFLITPSFLSSLTRLHKLSMYGCPYPLSSSSLHGSPTNFFLVKRPGFNYSYDTVDLKKVDALKGTNPNNLELACLENVSYPKDVLNASLSAKSNLEILTLKWTDLNNPSIDEMSRDEAILENLRPPKSLLNLTLDGYSASKFPFWLMRIGHFLPNLSTLKLENLKACKNLPPLGILPNLSTLRLYNLPGLQKIIEPFIVGKTPFRVLQVLTLDSLVNLEEWPTEFPYNAGELVFTNLSELHVYNCPKLKFEPFFPTSKLCCIINSPQLLYQRESQKSSPVTIPVKQLIINQCDFQFGTLPSIIRQMTSLEILSIKSCNNLNVVPEWLGELISLRILYMRNCTCLDNLPPCVLKVDYIYMYIESNNPTLVKKCSLDNRFTVRTSGPNENKINEDRRRRNKKYSDRLNPIHYKELFDKKLDVLDRKIRYYDAINDDCYFDKLGTYKDLYIITFDNTRTSRQQRGNMQEGFNVNGAERNEYLKGKRILGWSSLYREMRVDRDSDKADQKGHSHEVPDMESVVGSSMTHANQEVDVNPIDYWESSESEKLGELKENISLHLFKEWLREEIPPPVQG